MFDVKLNERRGFVRSDRRCSLPSNERITCVNHSSVSRTLLRQSGGNGNTMIRLPEIARVGVSSGKMNV